MSSGPRRSTILALAITSALGAPMSCAAAGASFAAADDATRLDTVEVTAAAPTRLERRAKAGSRLDLAVGETPASVDVIDQDALRQRLESTTVEALDNAPGVVGYYSFGTLNVSGRGFAGVFNSPVMFDGIRYPGWQIAPRSTLNYAQVEVLRGPAGLSAGQGAVGGALNLVPQRADGVADTRAYAGFGRYGTWTLGAGHGGAIGDGAVRYRVDATYQASDERGSYGYADDTSFLFRHVTAEVAVPLGETLLASVAIDRWRDDAEGYFGTPLVEGRFDGRLRDANFNIVDDVLDMDARWTRARLEWTPSSAFRGRVVAFHNEEVRLWRNTEAYTYQPASATVRRADYLATTHDQALRGALAEGTWTHTLLSLPHQLVFGVQADRNDHDRASNSPFRFTDTVPLFPSNRGSFVSLDPFLPRTATDIEQRAGWMESRLDVAEGWRVISGWRHDRTDVESLNRVTGVRFDRRYVSNGARFGVTRALGADGMVYASWASGSEPPAQITTLGLANARFDLTDARQWELGLKQRLGRGDWTLALYDIERTNLLSRDPADPNLFQQIGAQGARGAEVSVRLPLAEAWTLEGSAAVLDAAFGRFDERVGTALASRRGNVPVNVPERLATTWLRWQATDAFSLAAGLRAVGRRPANTANTQWLAGYATLDLNANWRTGWGDVGLRVRNVADKAYATTAYNAGNQMMVGEPRWVEVVWQRRF
jgi:iron complex outermembrane receptor protein